MYLLPWKDEAPDCLSPRLAAGWAVDAVGIGLHVPATEWWGLWPSPTLLAGYEWYWISSPVTSGNSKLICTTFRPLGFFRCKTTQTVPDPLPFIQSSWWRSKDWSILVLMLFVCSNKKQGTVAYIYMYPYSYMLCIYFAPSLWGLYSSALRS